MTIETATPEGATVDAPASMSDIVSEIAAGNPAPDTADEVVKELVEEAEEGDSVEEADEDDATDASEEAEESEEAEPDDSEDTPEPAYKVKVNGEEVEVPLSELLKGYSRERDYTAKTMALGEKERSLTATLEAKFATELKQQVELFESLDPILSQAANIDWGKLAQEDPTTYVQLKAAVDERTAAVAAAKAKIGQAEQGLTQAEQAQQAEAAAAETSKLIEKLPELAKPEAMAGFANNAVNYLRGTGFEDGEIADLTDHRALLIIDKARRFDELEAAKAKLPAKTVVPRSSVKALKSDATGSDAPKRRFPVNAPQEKKLAHVADLILQDLKE